MSDLSKLPSPRTDAALTINRSVTVLTPPDIEDALKRLILVSRSNEQALACAMEALEDIRLFGDSRWQVDDMTTEAITKIRAHLDKP